MNSGTPPLDAERVTDGREELVQVDRLCQIVNRAEFQRFYRIAHVGVSRHQQERQSGMILPHQSKQLDAACAGHAYVADNEGGDVVLNDAKRLFRGGRCFVSNPADARTCVYNSR